jgi:hypothetical protein
MIALAGPEVVVVPVTNLVFSGGAAFSSNLPPFGKAIHVCICLLFVRQINKFHPCRPLRITSPRNPSFRFDPSVRSRKLKTHLWQLIVDQFRDGQQS